MNCRDVMILVPFQAGKCLRFPVNQVVGARGVGAFYEHIVVGIARGRQAARRGDDMASIPYGP
jgi:hypothetical protein